MGLENVNNYLIKLKLTDFINARVVDLENDDGIKEKGVFIPIDINNLFLSTRNTVIAWMFATKKLYEPIDRMSHYLKLKVGKEHKEKLKQLGYEPPYLGGMKETKIFTNYQKSRANNIIKRVKTEDYE